MCYFFMLNHNIFGPNWIFLMNWKQKIYCRMSLFTSPKNQFHSWIKYIYQTFCVIQIDEFYSFHSSILLDGVLFWENSIIVYILIIHAHASYPILTLGLRLCLQVFLVISQPLQGPVCRAETAAQARAVQQKVVICVLSECCSWPWPAAMHSPSPLPCPLFHGMGRK